MTHDPQDVLNFWKTAGEKKWFAKNDDFDADIKREFLGLYEDAASGKYDHWAEEPDACLALIIVLDQFPRNMFRDDPKAFAADAKALEIAGFAKARNHGSKVDDDLGGFLFMPYMHSENIEDQHESVRLQKSFGGPENVKAAEWHLDIIRRFGRFPHRNPVLGRTMTQAEQEYLNEGGFKG